MEICDAPVPLKLEEPIWNHRWEDWQDWIEVGCGKCYKCKMRRISRWTLKLEKEQENRWSTLFVTLTYDSKYVPLSEKGWMTLDKKDVQNFVKRIRSNRKRKVFERKVNGKWERVEGDLKYFCVGEYGGKGRPHYHLIMYDVLPEEIEEAWSVVISDDGKGRIEKEPIGIIDVQVAGKGAIRYCLKYMMKDETVEFYKDVLKEFNMGSKGLGESYLNDEMKRWHRKNGFENMFAVLSGGYKVSLPDDWRKKIWKEDELKMYVQYLNSEVFEEIEKGLIEHWSKTREENWDKWLSDRKMAREELKNRIFRENLRKLF